MGRIIDLYDDQAESIVRGAPGSFKPDFQIMTAGLWPDAQYSNLVHTVGSSTEQDLQGDFMSIEALNTMTKMPPNLTAWLNHSYNLPDDIFGSISGSPKILHQDGIADLHLDMDVEMDNPAAARVKKYIDNGRRLGTSIGCIVTKYEVPDESDGDNWFQQPVIIHGVRVLEFSIVGIPANQRSWVTNGIRGLFTRTLDSRLAPAMKSLWPRAFNEVMEKAANELEPHVFQKLLDAPTRPGADAKLLWNAPERKFFVVRGKQEQEVDRALLGAFVKSGAARQLPKAPVVTTDESLVEEEKTVEEVLLDTKEIEEGMKDNIEATKEVGDAIGFAVNKDGTPGVLVKASGEHDVTTGTHTHHHASHGHGDVKNHLHEHAHDGDNLHHHDHADMGGGEYCNEYPQDDGKDDGDGDDDRNKKDAPVQTTKQAEETQSESIEAPVTKDATEQVEQAEEVAPVPTLTPEQLAHLSSLNIVGKVLGLPEITAEYVQKAHLPVIKAGVDHTALMMHAKAMHDHLYTLTNGACCSNEMSMEEAQQDAAMAEGHDVAGNAAVRSVETDALMQKMADLTGALSALDVLALRKDAEVTGAKLATAMSELELLHGEIKTAQETLANIKNMPLGNPVAHQRSVKPGSTVSHQALSQIKDSTPDGDVEESLAQALKRTEIRTTKMANGQTISYRHWPIGVGKGCRPELTGDQMTFMFHDDILSYRENGAANVPLVDDPGA